MIHLHQEGYKSQKVIVYNWNKVEAKHCFPISDETCKKWIEELIEYLEKNKNEHCTYTMSGDTLVLVARDDEDTYDISISTRRGAVYAKAKEI